LQSSIASKILMKKTKKDQTAYPSGSKTIERASLQCQCWPAPRSLRRGRRGGLCGQPARHRQRCGRAPPNHQTLRVKDEQRSKPVSIVRGDTPRSVARTTTVRGLRRCRHGSALPLPSVSLVWHRSIWCGVESELATGGGWGEKLGLGEMGRRWGLCWRRRRWTGGTLLSQTLDWAVQTRVFYEHTHR
jgi:hypothetical protein